MLLFLCISSLLVCILLFGWCWY